MWVHNFTSTSSMANIRPKTTKNIIDEYVATRLISVIVIKNA